METLFYVAAAVAIISTVMTITRMNAVHALLYLTLSLLAVAAVFYSLGAYFVAALEVIIYAGAIMVLFIFVVMMLNLGAVAVEHERELFAPKAWIGPSILAVLLIAELLYAASQSGMRGVTPSEVGPKEIGLALYGPYIIGVELASILLLGALVGAYHLGWRVEPGKEEIDAGRSGRARAGVSGDLVRVGSDGNPRTPERDFHADVH